MVHGMCIRVACWHQKMGLTYRNTLNYDRKEGNRDGYCSLFLFLIREQYIGGRDPRSPFIGSGCWWMCHNSNINLEWRYWFESKSLPLANWCCAAPATRAPLSPGVRVSISDSALMFLDPTFQRSTRLPDIGLRTAVADNAVYDTCIDLYIDAALEI